MSEVVGPGVVGVGVSNEAALGRSPLLRGVIAPSCDNVECAGDGQPGSSTMMEFPSEAVWNEVSEVWRLRKLSVGR